MNPGLKDFECTATQSWLEEHCCWTIDEKIMAYCSETEYNLKKFVEEYRTKYPDIIIFNNEKIDE